MPHRRVIRRLRDPEKRRAFIVVAVVTMLAFAGLLWALVIGVNHNSNRIDKTPTKEEVYRALVELRRAQRRACQVVNRRFTVLAGIIEKQRPDPRTTAYYADHPGELAKARRDFDQTLRALRPRNCLRDYPPPNPSRFGLSPSKRSKPHKPRRSSTRGPSSSSGSSSPTSRPQSSPPRQREPTRTFPTSRPRRPATPQTPPAPAQQPPANLPLPPGVTPTTPQQPPAGPPPTVRDRVCADPTLAPLLPFC